MSLWLSLTLALLVQEGIAAAVLLLEAYHQHYSPVVITLIWLVATLFQICAGYYVGKWTQKRFVGTKFELFVNKYAEKLKTYIGTSGESIALILVGEVISPAISAFGASWLGISFTRALIFAGIGDTLWYLSEWVTVLGLTKLMSVLKIGIGVVIIGFIAAALLFQLVRRLRNNSLRH